MQGCYVIGLECELGWPTQTLNDASEREQCKRTISRENSTNAESYMRQGAKEAKASERDARRASQPFAPVHSSSRGFLGVVAGARLGISWQYLSARIVAISLAQGCRQAKETSSMGMLATIPASTRPSSTCLLSSTPTLSTVASRMSVFLELSGARPVRHPLRGGVGGNEAKGGERPPRCAL